MSMPGTLPRVCLFAAAVCLWLPGSFASAQSAERSDLWGLAVAGSPAHATRAQRLAEIQQIDRNHVTALTRDADRHRGVDRGVSRSSERGIVRYGSPRTTVTLSTGSTAGLDASERSRSSLRDRDHVTTSQRFVPHSSRRDFDSRSRFSRERSQPQVIIRGNTAGLSFSSSSRTAPAYCPPTRSTFNRGFSRSSSSFQRGFDRHRGGASLSLQFGHR